MDYRWRYQNETGSDVSGPAETFAGQSEAEDWLSASWQELLESGVEQVTLLAGEAEVYGPMSLRAAS